MIAQSRALLIDYVNALTAFLAEIQIECAKSSSSIKSGDKLGWEEILIYRTEKPLPTLKEHFQSSYENLLDTNNQSTLIEIDKTIAILNEAEEIITWKQGVNYLLQSIQGISYKPFYHGDEYRPELFIPT